MQTMRWMCCWVIALCAQAAQAHHLMEVWQLAKSHNPDYQQVMATLKAAEENPALARAALLPHLNITAGIESARHDMGGLRSDHTDDHYGASLDQSWSISAWQKLRLAHHQVLVARAQQKAAEQDLMLRVATAYMDVLDALAQWRALAQQAQALDQAYHQARDKLGAGVSTETDVQEARARWLMVRSQQAMSFSAIIEAQEHLTELVGCRIKQLADLGDRLPLNLPHAWSLKHWDRVAYHQHPAWQAAREQFLVSRLLWKALEHQHGPTISLRAQWLSQRNALQAALLQHHAGSAGSGHHRLNTVLGQAKLTLPVYAGGAIQAAASQAEAQSQQTHALLEATGRHVVSSLHHAYWATRATMIHVKAAYQALLAQRMAYRATAQGLAAGTRTMLDVLGSLSRLSERRAQYAQACHRYVLMRLKLAHGAGIISTHDMERVNGWLTHDRVIPTLSSLRILKHPKRT